MNESGEPWNNSYQRDGDTEFLLRKLEATDGLTDDEVAREFLRDQEIRPLLDSQSQGRGQRNMLSGLAQFVLSFGKSSAFSDAIQSSMEEINALRHALDWSRVPHEVRDLALRRAGFILAHGQAEGLVERSSSPAGWRISARGRALLAAGGFSMK